MKQLLIVFTLSLVTAANLTYAADQPPTVPARNTPVVQEKAPAKPSGKPQDGSTKTGKSKTAKKNPLVEELLKTSFARTPEEILKAWSEKPKTSKPVGSEIQKPFTAKILNVFEEFVVVGLPEKTKLTPNQNVTLSVGKKQDKTLKTWKASVLSADAKKASLKLTVGKGEKIESLKKDVQLTVSPVANKKPVVTKTEPGTKQKVATFKKAVLLAQWPQVKSFLATLPTADADKVFKHVLNSIHTAAPAPPNAAAGQPATPQPASPNAPKPPTSFLTPKDIFALLDAAPGPLVEEHVVTFSAMISKSRLMGHSYLQFVDRLDKGTGKIGGKDAKQRLLAASLLMKSNLVDDVARFLPKLEDPSTMKDATALEIWSDLAITKYRQKKIADWLKKAWTINQNIVGLKDAKQPQRNKAMQHLIELAPQVDRNVGQAWLNQSFTESPERGMLILSSLGSKTAEFARNAKTMQPTERLKLLRLQNSAVESLIRVAPKTAKKWQHVLTLLAQNWIEEATIAVKNSKQSSRRPYMQIDMYGNYYWIDPAELSRRYGNNRYDRPIKIGDLLVIRPSQQWRELIDNSLHIVLFKSYADLHLRINEEDEAFPFIEKIAPTHPEIAKELVHEFLGIWTRNHDPNTDKRRRNPYIYFYGFDRKAEAIPLTRSKQERNLRELSGWVKRIRKMPIDGIDERKLAEAFTTCHSSAEVFHLDRVKSVFGSLDSLKPETIAAICQKMRTNLATNWRDVRTQEAKQTRRREPEVQQEVMRGYTVAKTLAAEALRTHPENWQLHLAMACLMYDENAYSQTVQKSSEFSDRRDRAFDQFKLAATKYHDVAESLDKSKQSTEVYDFWFYASLGACDLGKITNETVPDLRQYKKIREAIVALPGSLGQDHLSKFANNLFTRMNPIKPEIKFRYLRGGFQIVGDHPRAWEAKNLFDYYKDLVNEIKLDIQIDGSDVVGHKTPFGVYVRLLHTTEIEREAGGFGKYVQNQNNSIFAYNYGRPTEDYRDKFQQTVNQALSEHFEVLNVTFEGPKTMRSRPADQPGWRVTPYAYILLKARGPEVDRIQPIKLDLDFLDTSGYVVIPIESPAVVVDSSDDAGEPRPAADIKITQTLDERRAEDGKLIVEIAATAKGLVPDLKQLIDVKKDNFELINIDDQGVLPTTFDSKSDEIQIVSDRSWTVEYAAVAQKGKTSEFSFSKAIVDAENKFQRYKDADLVAAKETVKLERNYGRTSYAFLFWLIPLIAILVTAGIFALIILNKPAEKSSAEFHVPEEINPFTVLTLLNSIKERNGIAERDLSALQTSISRIEHHFFSETPNGELEDELDQIAKTWVEKAN